MRSLERAITPAFVLRFTLSTMLMMVFNAFYTMVDGGFVSRFVGTGALSAINIVYPVINLVFAIGIMLATGGSAVVARQMGEGHGERAKQSFTLITLLATLAGGVSSIVLDYVFIVPLGMGIRGAALATGVGFAIPAVIGLAYFAGRRGRLLHFKKPVWDGKMLLRTCTNGSSEMVSNLSVVVTAFLFNRIMMRLLGEDGVAAMTIVFYAQFLFTAIFLGYTSGVAPLISFNYGAQNTKRLKKLFRISIIFVTVCSIVAFLLSILLAEPVVGVFAKAGGAVFALAKHGMGLFAIGFLFMGLNIFASGPFTALSNGKISALLSFLHTFAFILPAIHILPAVWAVDGVWLAVPAAKLLALAVSLWFVIRRKKVYAY